MDRGVYAVRVGDTHLYSDRPSGENETYNITVKNVRSRAKVALLLTGGMKNVRYENIEVFDGGKLLEDKR